jgi:nitric oxide reductase NorQ protein
MTSASLFSPPVGGAGTPADPLAAYRIGREPYYRAVGDEVSLFDVAHALRLPLMPEGPVRCQAPGCARPAR